VHPQEVDYNIDTLFKFIDVSGLEFIGFSNPDSWQLETLIGNNQDLINRAKNLTNQQRYRLIELLNPDNITHYEFFLTKPPLIRENWEDNELLKQAKPELNPCMLGWESKSLFNYQFQPISIDDEEFAFMQYCAKNPSENLTVEHIISQTHCTVDLVRSLIKKQLIMLVKS
jgi:hypothetical protein